MSRLVVSLGVGLLLALGAPTSAQRGTDDETVDPYTGGDADVQRAAGYVPGPGFAWSDSHTTGDLEQMLGQVGLRWIETAHFKLGSTLPEVRVTKDDKARVRVELQRLAERLPNVPTRPRALDPWLRAHLYAQRLEELYADLSERLGVTDADFVGGADGGAATVGPYLGQRDKFTVLLLEKKSSLGRCANAWGRTSAHAPFRVNFPERGGLGFATTSEFFQDEWDNDTALHCHVVWNVTQNLLDGFKSYRHPLPKWLREGVAHWYVRRIDPRYAQFSAIRGSSTESTKEWNWEPKVRSRVKFEVYPAAEELLRWPEADVRDFSDHMMMWSRVDFLMSHHPERMANFIARLKDPIELDPTLVPTEEHVFARQDEALRAAFEFDEAGFDAAWSEWVLDNYAKR